MRIVYHIPIVFASKYSRKVIYGKLKEDIGYILRELCERKAIEIVEANACIDHIYVGVKIPSRLSVPSFMAYLKGKVC